LANSLRGPPKYAEHMGISGYLAFRAEGRGTNIEISLVSLSCLPVGTIKRRDTGASICASFEIHLISLPMHLANKTTLSVREPNIVSVQPSHTEGQIVN
jgi:hypothetical protein